VRLRLETASLLLDVVGLGPPTNACPGRATEGEGAADIPFREFGNVLLGGMHADSEGDAVAVRAGQQVRAEQISEKAKARGAAAETSAQGQCLLGSMAAAEDPLTGTSSAPLLAGTEASRVAVTGWLEAPRVPVEGPGREPALPSPAERETAGSESQVAGTLRPGAQSVPVMSMAEAEAELLEPMKALLPVVPATRGDPRAQPNEETPEVASAEIAPPLGAKAAGGPDQKAPYEASTATQADRNAGVWQPDLRLEALSAVRRHGLDDLLLGGTSEKHPNAPRPEADTGASSASPTPSVRPQDAARAADGTLQPAPQQAANRVQPEAERHEAVPRQLLPDGEASPVDPVPSVRPDGGRLGGDLPEGWAAGFERVQQPETRREAPDASPDRGLQFIPLPEAGLPGARAAEAAAGSNGRLPPEGVLAAKVINQIVRAAKVHLFEGGGNVALRLEPPHLGTVHMTVTAANGAVTAAIQTSTESAKQVLESDLAGLKQALGDAGVKVDSINVSVGGSSDQSWNPHAGANGWPAEGRGRGAWHAPSYPGPELAPEPTNPVRLLASSRFDYLA